MARFFDFRRNTCQPSNANGGSSTPQPTVPQSTITPTFKQTHHDPGVPSQSDEAPPTYTSSADMHSGEITIGIGPRPPCTLSPKRPSPQPTSSSRIHALRQIINRLIPRPLRCERLQGDVMSCPDDRNSTLQALETLSYLEKESEPDVESVKPRADITPYISDLVLKPGASIDIDLLDGSRSLIHSGKLLHKPGSIFHPGWTELFVLLFDDYLIITKPRKRDGVVKYHLYGRPILLDVLMLANSTDPPTRRNTGFLRKILSRCDPSPAASTSTQGPVSPGASVESRAVFRCNIHHNGRVKGLYTIYAESSQIRGEWKLKLEEAIGKRKVVQESNKVFEIETISVDTFWVPSIRSGVPAPARHDSSFAGQVLCSVPFTTLDGRRFVAIGCTEGLWIGFRGDSRSMRRVLDLKMVTQCALLEDFGIFLVLADKSLFAYHIESLVPCSPQSAHASKTPWKLNGNKDVHFFRVGTLQGRTLVIYMKKKNFDSVFRVLEPLIDNIGGRADFPSRLGFRAPRSEWFRVYRDFSLPSDSFDLVFLKAKIAILCSRGFEIMDLTDFRSVTIPQRDDPRLKKLARRCESSRPLAMFPTNDDEFLLCYDEFGLYVDKHGDPSRSTGTIEWEGTAERAALHPPYVLLFDSRFIEVRLINTGRLCQIMPGNDIRCIWDGRGLISNAAATLASDTQDDPSQEALIQAVMTETEHDLLPGFQSLRAVTQHVFELVPTIPLGSMASSLISSPP